MPLNMQKRDAAKATIYTGLELALSGLTQEEKNNTDFLIEYLTDIFNDALNYAVENIDKYKNVQMAVKLKVADK